jgi:hypothetical protein
MTSALPIATVNSKSSFEYLPARLFGMDIDASH